MPPDTFVGLVTRSFFNSSRLNKSRQFFKMVDEKNNVTFHISKQLSMQEKISSYGMENFVKLWIRNSRPIGAAQERVKRKFSEEIRYYELTDACMHGGKNGLGHVEEEQDKPRK